MIQEQLDWIKSGKIGCVFATVFARNPEAIGWRFYPYDLKGMWDYDTDRGTGQVFIASILFPNMNAEQVRAEALEIGMYIEDIDGMYEGLRMKVGDAVSWVQYFGPDSHVKTRQAPYPMLTFTVKLPAHVYAKTMVKGIYHLAHASIKGLSARKADVMWESSFKKTEKELGRSPGLAEAAKTTFIK